MAEVDAHAPARSQSTTSLARLYHGASENGSAPPTDETSDPTLDFCNAFWGQGTRGYEVIMARLRGAARTNDEMRLFFKERAAIEEDYAKRLAKLAKMPIGRDEVGDLAAALNQVVEETALQASYHMHVSGELHSTVEQPNAEFNNRLTSLKKGLQASVEKSYRNKGLQEGHVAKARERYKSDCIKLNEYTANQQLTQGRELEKLQTKIDRLRQTIPSDEQDLRNFVSVLEQTNQKWENEWRTFCDHVQDIEEERLVHTKDIVWAYANAVSQVCVEDDTSCERIREKLEQFEPVNDMVNFVRGWGTGSCIPDPPRFINYSAGEDDSIPGSFRNAQFRRLSSRPPMSAPTRTAPPEEETIPEPPAPAPKEPTPPKEEELFIPPVPAMQGLSLHDPPVPSSETKTPFGGVAMPGLTSAPAEANREVAPVPPSPKPGSVFDMGPPPALPSVAAPSVVAAPAPPSPSARDVADEEDPMARALAQLRSDPPGPRSVRRQQSQRRTDSIYSASGRPGSTTGSAVGSNVGRAPSPSPSSAARQTVQQPPAAGRASVDTSLLPPATGHTAAALARSMADFERKSNTSRNSVNYSSFADNVVGSHPSHSRPTTPTGRAPSPSAAMMQPPTQPVTHIADSVLPLYGQAFPGERSRSRPTSVYSSRSRPGSIMESIAPQQQVPSQQQQPPASPRAGFVGIGAGAAARTPSPGPQHRAPSPAPGVLGAPNLGIELDQHGGVAHDSMAEAYRRQYEAQRQQAQGQEPPQQPQAPPPQAAAQQQQYQDPRASQYGGQSPYQQQQQQQQQQAPPSNFPPQPQQGSVNSQYAASMRLSYDQQAGQQPQYDPPGQQPYDAQAYPRHQSYDSQSGRQASPYDPQQQQQQYAAQQPPASPNYQGYPQAQPQQPQQQPPQQQPPQQFGQHAQQPQQYSQHSHTPSFAGSYASQQQPPQQPPAQPAQQPQQYYQQQPAQQNGYAQAQPAGQYGGPPAQPQQPQQPPQQQYQQPQRSPSPQPNVPPPDTHTPTGQWAANGQPVLFYVKALYDYAAQSPAEFDFQAGDIIAVTNTPEDGWWSGELLDEARRRPGQTDFPSNFVTYF